MTFAPIKEVDNNTVIGRFVESQFGHTFEYSKCTEGEVSPFPGYDRKVWTGPYLGKPTDQGFRWAKVVKTRAYIVTDEVTDGSPVIDRWTIRAHTEYTHNL